MALYGLPMRPISGKLDPREVGDRNGEPQGLCARQRFHGFGPEHCCGRGRNPTPRAGRAGRGKSAKQRQGRTDGEHVYLYTPIHSRLVARPLRWRRRGSATFFSTSIVDPLRAVTAKRGNQRSSAVLELISLAARPAS
jgi:hypothetical protein